MSPTTEASHTDPESLHKAIAAGVRPARANALTASLAFGGRGLLKLKHVPEQLFDATIGPILLLVMFTYLFGGAIGGSPVEYLQFLLPGILVMSVLLSSVYSGVALHNDMATGVVDRFRSLPIWQPAPLLGALLGDAVRYATTAVVVIVTGVILGFRADGGITGLLAGGLLVVVFAFSLSWVFTALGLALRSASAVQGIGMMVVFILTFVSNVFVDPSTLPQLLHVVVDLNPVSHLATAVRDVMAGHPDTGNLLLVGSEIAVVTAVFGFITARLYEKG